MTKREMFEAIVNGRVDNDVVEMAKLELERLDKANARKAEKSKSAKAEADAPISKAILEFVMREDRLVLASWVADEVGVSTQKAQALLRKMCDCGMLECVDVKVDKVGKRKAYGIARTGLVD